MNRYRGVAFLGNREVGKTTSTQYIFDNYLVQRYHPKTVMGEMITPILLRSGVSPNDVLDYIFGDRINDPLPLRPQYTTRRLLQAAGGGFLDDMDNPGFYHDLLMPSNFPPTVIESVRRKKEADALRARGFYIIMITRPGKLCTFEHSTEDDLSDYPADLVIDNDSTVEVLYAKLDGLATLLQWSPAKYKDLIVVVNGRPRSGKDEFTNAFLRAASLCGFDTHFMSSIDPVRNMLRVAGVDVFGKTPEDRVCLAEIKESLERHSNFTTKALAKTYRNLCNPDNAKPFVFVTHIREPENIAKLQAYLGGYCSREQFRSVWIRRPGSDTTQHIHSSDKQTDTMFNYDYLVNNVEDVASLGRMAHQAFLDMVAGRIGLISP